MPSKARLALVRDGDGKSKGPAPRPAMRRHNRSPNRKPHPPKNRPVGEETRVTIAHQQALELRRAGGTYRDIATAMGISLRTAYEYVNSELLMLRELTVEDAEAVRDLELSRCDAMLAGLWRTGATKGDPASVMSALKVMERRAKLLGLDAPSQSQVMGAFAALTPEAASKMSDKDLFARIAAITAKIPKDLPDIDTTAEVE